MNDREEEILKIGFESGKKAIEMHPNDDSYDVVRMKEARLLVEELTVLKDKSEYLTCSQCKQPHITVSVGAFDGKCADCTDSTWN